MWRRTRRGQETLSIGDRYRLKIQDIPNNGFKYSNKIFDMIDSDMSEDSGNEVSNLRS